MFKDDQPACGHERPPDLAEGRSYIINRAQHQPDVHRVEPVVRKRFQVSFRPSSMALVFAIDALAISLLGSVPPARRPARLIIIEAVGVE
jgi:ABC-type lipoprotein release transport system permease subunit